MLASTAFAPADVNVPRAEADEWRRALRGDIDAVLSKTLRPRPEERYATATAMADDLRRVLAGTRVAVRREQLAYRAGKFMRRHRVAFAVTAVVLLFLAGQQIAGRWQQTHATPFDKELAVYRDSATDSATLRSLIDGAERLARFDAAGARASFLEATKTSRGHLPDEALAWDGVARAENALGETGRAADAARRAGTLIAAHAGTLPRHEAERLRARAFAADHDWNHAIPIFETLFGAQPDRADIGIDLATTLLACGRTDAADTTVGRLRQLAENDPRIDLLESTVSLQYSEYQRAAAAASRARDRAARLHAVALGRQAARLHGEAIAFLDRREEARHELESVAAGDAALGLTRETAAARLALGPILLRTNNAEAQRVLEQALDGCTHAGDRRCQIIARSQLAIVAGGSDRLPEAIRSARGALADARALGDRWAEGYVLSQLLTLYNWADDDVSTNAVTEETLAALRDSGNRRVLMSTLTNLAIIAIEALDLEKGEAYLVEAEGLARRVGSEVAYASIDRSRGYLEQTRGDLDLARKSYTSAVERARRAGVPLSIGNYLSDLAWLEIAADRPGPAAERAQEAIAVYQRIGNKRAAVETEGVLAWAEARQGNGAAARRRLDHLRTMASKDGSANARFDFLSIEARVATATGDWPRAIELRREAVRMATAWNARGLVIEQKANLAEALQGAGKRRELEKLVRELLPEVEHYGLRGIARDLRALLASPSGKS
jgi:tetratricopeptide (TPR) repeat protein